MKFVVRTCSDGVHRNTFQTECPKTRFLRFVIKGERPSDCWLWTGSLCGSGPLKYGNFWDGKKPVKAHRFSYEAFSGKKIPDGKLACHKCDNPICVNPDHLFFGSHADNKNDCIRKGRQWYRPMCGENNASHKYSEQQVRYFLKLRESNTMTDEACAKKAGISRTAAGAIVQGRTWTQVTGFSKNDLIASPRHSAQARIRERRSTLATPSCRNKRQKQFRTTCSNN